MHKEERNNLARAWKCKKKHTYSEKALSILWKLFSWFWWYGVGGGVSCVCMCAYEGYKQMIKYLEQSFSILLLFETRPLSEHGAQQIN